MISIFFYLDMTTKVSYIQGKLTMKCNQIFMLNGTFLKIPVPLKAGVPTLNLHSDFDFQSVQVFKMMSLQCKISLAVVLCAMFYMVASVPTEHVKEDPGNSVPWICIVRLYFVWINCPWFLQGRKFISKCFNLRLFRGSFFQFLCWSAQPEATECPMQSKPWMCLWKLWSPSQCHTELCLWSDLIPKSHSVSALRSNCITQLRLKTWRNTYDAIKIGSIRKQQYRFWDCVDWVLLI